MKSFVNALAAGTTAPVYLLYGNELEPMRACVRALRAHVLEPGMESFNHERFAGRELEGMGPVLSACAQLPVMAPLRLVELDDPECVGKGRSDALKAQQDALVEYIKAPNPSTVLVLKSSGIDGRSRLVTASKKSGVVAKFDAVKHDRDAIRYLADAARERGLQFERDALEQLVVLVGTRTSDLLHALERAGLHAGQGATITRDDAQAVCAHTREAVIFELTDAVGAGSRDQALRVLARLFADSQGSPASQQVGTAAQVLAMLVRQLRLLLVTHTARCDPQKTAQLAGVPPFLATKLVQQAKRFPLARVRQAYAGLCRLDRDLKGGAASVSQAPLLGIQRWIVDTCGGLPGASPRC